MRTGGLLRTTAASLAGVLVVGGGSYVLLASGLRHATEQDRIAVRVLQRLERERGGHSVEHVGGRRLLTTCVEISSSRRSIFLSDGVQVALKGTRVWTVGEASGRALAVHEPELAAATADLSGSRFLYVEEVARSIVRGRHVLAGETIFAGVPAYRVHLSDARPLAEIFVDRDTLRPLGAHYRSARLEGWSRFLPGPPAGFPRRLPAGRAGC